MAPDETSGHQTEVDHQQWRAIDFNRVLAWVNIAITLIGLAGLADDLRFWHDEVFVPAGAWLKQHLPLALIPFDFIYLLIEWWRWILHGLFDLLGLQLPRSFQSLIGVYVLLGNTTLLVLRNKVSARGRIPYTRLEFVKGMFLQLMDVRTLGKWLLARPRANGEYIKYLIDALLFVTIWGCILVGIGALFFQRWDVAKTAALLMILCMYGVLMGDGLYFGSTRWYTLNFVLVVAFMYLVNSVYGICCAS